MLVDRSYFKMEKLYALLILGILALIPNSLFSQAAMISGKIIADPSGELLEGTTVYIPELEKGTFTDASGQFSFIGVTPGNYTLDVSMIGYESQQIDILVNNIAALNINVSLVTTSVNLVEIVIQEQRDMSQTISTISKIDLELRPIKSSQDILRMVPGLFTAQHAGGGKSEQIFLRGFDIDHGTDIAISVDGMPVNMVSHAHGQGYADLHFLIPETVKKVDFNKGPYYAKHGDFTTAGYVDFSTRTALEYSSIKLEKASFNTHRAVGLIDLLGENENNANAYFASELLFTDGPVESPQNFSRINLMGKYTGLLGDDRLISISASHFTSKWDASGQIPERAVAQGLISRFGFLDDSEGGNTSRSNVNFKLLKTFDNNDFLSNQLYFVNNQFQLFSNFTFFLNDPVNGDQIQQYENRNIFGYKLVYGFDREIGKSNFSTEVGFNIRFDQTKDTDLTHTFERNTLLDYYALGDIDQLNATVYVSEKWKVSKKITIKGGLRFDQFRFGYVDKLDSLYNHQVVDDHIVSPKLSVFFNASPAIQLYAKAGIGFHSNDSRVVVAQKGTETLPKAYGLDIGVFLKPTPNLFLNIAAWSLDLDQEFVYVGDEGVVEPSGKTRRYGVDFSARYQLTKWLFVDTDLNYTVPRSKENLEGSNYIPLAPTFTSIGGLTAKFENGFNASLRYRRIGDRPANENNTVIAEGYFIVDGGLTYTQGKYELGLSFENLLNVDWNEAQFDTETRLFDEVDSVSELHFTPGTPFFIKGSVTFFF